MAPAHRPHSPPTRSRPQTESVFGELPASPVMQLGAESSRAPCRSSWRAVSNGSKLVAVLKRLLGNPRGASSGYAATQALAARWPWLSIAGHATCSPNVGSRARRTSRTRSELLHDGGPLNCVGPGSRQGSVSSWANASPSRWTSAAEIDVRSATLSTTHVRRNFSRSIRRVKSAACASAFSSSWQSLRSAAPRAGGGRALAACSRWFSSWSCQATRVVSRAVAVSR